MGKRTFKKAVHRNKLKRRMREAVRLHLQDSEFNPTESKSLALMFIYVGKEMHEYALIEQGIKKLLIKLKSQMDKTSKSK